ncbi:leucyl aminopeptidase [Shewanella submarina]|uniref:Probable cytosol aminopeptidase n=1 Tax=Shewanella submarina TaxID=2016376 RepID=A0ABV7GJ15_9GAMM|nr:leucyl aminopeptidase [Shewanella submarina]MCL1035944.1 leucyl aminopeptidase [Shewanella submarina]
MNKIPFTLSLLAASCLTAAPAIAETFSFGSELNQEPKTLVLFQQQDGELYSAASLPTDTKNQIKRAAEAAQFKGAQGQMLEVLAPNGIEAGRLVVIGLGDDALTEGEINTLGGKLATKLNSLPKQQVGVLTQGIADSHEFAAQFAHGIELKSYRFTHYKASDAEPKHFHLVADDANGAQALHKQLQAVEAGVFLARDMTNMTPEDLYPGSFAEEAKKLKKLGVKVKVLDMDDLEDLNMGALVGVGKGSEREPMLVVAQWQGSDDAPIALVGKGITFDSGGYNIKATGTSIVRMKSDMAGAATVLGTVKAMAMQKAPVNVVAVMPLAENMVSSKAQRPGDVVRTAEGKTVEVTNTDAEGRLILADGLWYAREYYQPQMIVDVATLTGSKVRALGREFTGLFSDDAQMVNELTFAGERVGEKLWRLPLAKAYGDELKSDIADLKNTGSTAGASVAAMFLKEFVGDSRWAHLDIAGDALTSSGTGVAPVGATGHGVRLLSYWLTEEQK